jgi:hypothetical protein
VAKEANLQIEETEGQSTISQQEAQRRQRELVEMMGAQQSQMEADRSDLPKRERNRKKNLKRCEFSHHNELVTTKRQL